MLIVLKSWSLCLLEPSGPVQACNGIALPLPLWIEIHLRPKLNYEFQCVSSHKARSQLVGFYRHVVY
jgi:hypothetical protein